MKTTENPDPTLFTTYERLENCHRTEVTEGNAHRLAKHFGCTVDYSGDVPTLRNPSNHPVEVGSWLDSRGSRWHPEPLTQGWSPEGTFTTVAVPTPAGPSERDAIKAEALREAAAALGHVYQSDSAGVTAAIRFLEERAASLPEPTAHPSASAGLAGSEGERDE